MCIYIYICIYTHLYRDATPSGRPCAQARICRVRERMPEAFTP